MERQHLAGNGHGSVQTKLYVELFNLSFEAEKVFFVLHALIAVKMAAFLLFLN